MRQACSLLGWKGIGWCLACTMLGPLSSLNETHSDKVPLIRLLCLIKFLSRLLAPTVWTTPLVHTKHTGEQKELKKNYTPRLLLSFSWKFMSVFEVVKIVNLFLFVHSSYLHSFSRAKLFFLTSEKNLTMKWTDGNQSETMAAEWIVSFQLCWAPLLVCGCVGMRKLFLCLGSDESHLRKAEIIETALQDESITIKEASLFPSCFSFSLFLLCFSEIHNPCFRLCHSVFFIYHGFSLGVHLGQASIPCKASGSPHLVTYLHIRSAVTGMVYSRSCL